MSPLNLVTDAYDRQARLYPALLLIAPVVVTGIVWLPAKVTGLQALVAALVGFGGAFILTELARDAGKKGERSLFEKWGGMPSIAIFRHRDARLDGITKARYHKKLASLVKEAEAPTVEREQAHPAAADAVYSTWSNYLRVNTRDTRKFPLLFKENVSYGYRRNVWGLRPVGVTLSFVSLAICGIRLYGWQPGGVLVEPIVGAALFSMVCLVLWLFRFTPEWVRVPADAYAERLAECSESIGGKTSAASKA